MKEVELLKYNGIVMSEKADSVPYNYRVTYKISVCTLILGICCRGGGCSETKMQVINNYMYSKESKKKLLDYLGNREKLYLALRYDPSVEKTLNFMLYDDMIYMKKNGSLYFTAKGLKFKELLIESEEILLEEKNYLKAIGSKLTEKIIDEIQELI